MSDSKDAFCSHVNVSLDLWTPSLGTVGGGGHPIQPIWSLIDGLLLMLQGWKRNGHSCYMVTSHEQNYEDALLGYYCQAPLLTVENRCFIEQNTYCVDILFIFFFFLVPTAFEFLSSPLRFEQAFINSLLSESGANSSTSYWIDLTDMDDMGEYRWRPHSGSSLPLTFTNWNKHQPGRQL